MSPPSFLATDFAFDGFSGVNDVQVVMNAIATMLTSTLSATPTNQWPNGQRWTLVAANTYKSPLDAGGKFMQILLTRALATQLQFNVQDAGGAMSAYLLNISSLNAQCEIFGGPGHLVVNLLNGATWEYSRAFIADPTPEPPAANISSYVFATGYRNTGNVVQAPVWASWQFRFWGGTLSNAVLFNYGALALPTFVPQNTSINTHLMTQAGSQVAAPYYVAVPDANASDSWKPSGKLYQCVLVDSNLVDGSDQSIPIDTGVIGIFRVGRFGAQRSMKLAIRKG